MYRLNFPSTAHLQLVESDLDVVVTGCGGWLGQATLEMLDSSLGAEMTSRVHAFALSGRAMTLRSGSRLEARPLNELAQLQVGPHLLAHYAFATRERVSELGINEYIRRNRAISKLVQDHVAKTRPVGILNVSSGAVYSGDDLATNPYGVLKARDELRFLKIVEHLAEGGSVPRLVIPRLFNLAGPFLNKPDHYVLGSIIRDIRAGGPIRLHASKPVLRSYVHVGDLIGLGFAVMLGKEESPSIFDTAGEREIEVGELAQLAASVLGVANMVIERPPFDGSEPDRYVGDPTAIRALATSYGFEMKTLSTQIVDTANYLGV